MKYLFNFWRCWGKQHYWLFDGYTLGGDWIRCQRCGLLEEYLLGLHEPKGYVSHNATPTSSPNKAAPTPNKTGRSEKK